MDHSRVNEFGYSGDMIDEAAAAKTDGDMKKELEDKSSTSNDDNAAAAAPAKTKTNKAKKED